jgi:RNA polymerase sigma-70 factor (ECF subfamily)
VEIEDRELVRRVLAGQTDDFRVLIERHQLSIFRFGSRLLGNREEAQDVTQEAFLAAFANLSGYDSSRAAFSSWLFTIARNRCINLLKQSRPIALNKPDLIGDVPSVDPIVRQELSQQLDRALAALSVEQRSAFILAEIEELPYAEIARIERISLGTVKSRILARKLLPKNYFPERGDLIVFRNPTPSKATAFAKRVVAVAGDHIEIHGERLLINGKELERYRVPDESLKHLGKQVRGRVSYEMNSGHRYLVAYGDSSDEGRAQGDFEATISERHVFVLGDNRDRSKDSRHFGSIHIGDVVGYVDYVYWPSESWSRFGVVNDWMP